uniref:Solute carrier family 25 member 45 n=1 Tax=Cyclopterus lumpus TaxID=8103 RepID=A0A8C3A606_CYCLU
MPFIEFIAGSVSGALGLAVGYPLDTMKVRLQAQSAYQGILHCMSKTYSNEGVCVNAPIDLVKVCLQGQTTVQRYRGPVHCVTVILREEGPKGLFRGGLAIALRDIPSYGLYFLPYEVTRKALTQSGEEPGTFATMMAGGMAGVVTWAFATPMDVVKARLQMSRAGGREYRGVLHCMRVSFREEGARVFFKGLLLNSLRAFPVNAVMFLSYESLMSMYCPPTT